MVHPRLSHVSQITPEIFVGPLIDAIGMDELEALGIRYCINMQAEFDDRTYGLALENYLYLPTIDEEAPSLDQLGRGVEFIQNAVDEGGKVYIHCMGGLGRSPTMAAAYFISKGLTFDEAMELLVRGRPIIGLSPYQINQLNTFEADYKNQRK